MLTLNGWVAVPRTFLEPWQAGRLSLNEAAVLLALTLLADAATGAGRINAPALRTLFPELSYPAAKRVLLSLEEKGFVLREIVPHAKALYRYWIDGYEISRGEKRGFQTKITQVAGKRQLTWVSSSPGVPEGVPDPIPEGVPDPIPEGVPDPLPNNNKNTDKHKNTDLDTSPNSKGWNGSMSELRAQTVSARSAPMGAGDALHVRVIGASPVGLFRDHSSGLFKDLRTKQTVYHDEVNKRIAPLDLRWISGGDYQEVSTGKSVPWSVAMERITGEAAV